MNDNLFRIEMSGIRRFFNKVKNVDGAISLTLGQPDFDTPMEIKYGMIKAIEENKTVYTDNFGVLDLRREISKYLKHKGIHYEYDEICVTVGGSEALFSSLAAIINKGDKVLIPTPAYPAYENIVKIIGGEVINFKLNEDFSLDFEGLEMLIKKENIKYMILSYPSNPTGAILSQEEYIKLARIIEENNLTVISDEVYEAFCYDEYYSVAMCEDIRKNVIYIGGFSKMFSMTGIRIGYIAAYKEIIDEIGKVHQYNVSCSNSIGQYGVIEGLRYGLYNVCNMKDEFIKRKSYVENRLRKMNVDFVSPKGAFYIFPSIKKFNLNSEELCEKLLYEEKVACVPGNAFGSGGEGFIRLSYCYSHAELEEALNRIEKFVKKNRE
ncbi:aminotransferase class I/II-fold pyridoxal phosphate-dependent enzyme [Clostridium sp. AL.422]|uniref:pyridoxal phosphate-dependent aminotransferase n=1 Tax=Clostridium TaxID=1485 RepID=UPI00293DDC7D|nr:MULTISPECIES: aminotransferase class I/II-fold pyridoxal phosphate-dependent enzyme [unclassified Clostridium]MDV4150619.1 aminotransferase class I/II-fold pyridoxal phosphate-dependent enzyme [Clostridium sp. AL.422]